MVRTILIAQDMRRSPSQVARRFQRNSRNVRQVFERLCRCLPAPSARQKENPRPVMPIHRRHRCRIFFAFLETQIKDVINTRERMAEMRCCYRRNDKSIDAIHGENRVCQPPCRSIPDDRKPSPPRRRYTILRVFGNHDIDFIVKRQSCWSFRMP